MNPNREELLFQLALTKPAPERAAWPDRESGGDSAFRARLEALLAAHEQPETLLATPADAGPWRDEFHESPTKNQDRAKNQGLAEFGPPLDDAPDEAVGQTLGRYKLLERVGEGSLDAGAVAVSRLGLRMNQAFSELEF